MFGSVLGLMAAGITPSNGQAPQFIKEVPIGNASFGLVIQAGTDAWVSLESSTDLRTWSEVASIATTNRVSLFVDEVNVDTGERFYRLRVPGTTVEQAQARWLAGGVTAYRYQLERVGANQPPYVLTGTVTVTNGQKIVTNALGDGQPVNQPDPADFPSIEELYAALNAAQLSGCRQVYSLYDAALGFPTRCYIDQRTAIYLPANAGNAVAYHLTGLEVLTSVRSSSEDCFAAPDSRQ